MAAPLGIRTLPQAQGVPSFAGLAGNSLEPIPRFDRDPVEVSKAYHVLDRLLCLRCRVTHPLEALLQAPMLSSTRRMALSCRSWIDVLFPRLFSDQQPGTLHLLFWTTCLGCQPIVAPGVGAAAPTANR